MQSLPRPSQRRLALWNRRQRKKHHAGALLDVWHDDSGVAAL